MHTYITHSTNMRVNMTLSLGRSLLTTSAILCITTLLLTLHTHLTVHAHMHSSFTPLSTTAPPFPTTTHPLPPSPFFSPHYRSIHTSLPTNSWYQNAVLNTGEEPIVTYPYTVRCISKGSAWAQQLSGQVSSVGSASASSASVSSESSKRSSASDSESDMPLNAAGSNEMNRVYDVHQLTHSTSATLSSPSPLSLQSSGLYMSLPTPEYSQTFIIASWKPDVLLTTTKYQRIKIKEKVATGGGGGRGSEDDDEQEAASDDDDNINDNLSSSSSSMRNKQMYTNDISSASTSAHTNMNSAATVNNMYDDESVGIERRLRRRVGGQTTPNNTNATDDITADDVTNTAQASENAEAAVAGGDVDASPALGIDAAVRRRRIIRPINRRTMPMPDTIPAPAPTPLPYPSPLPPSIPTPTPFQPSYPPEQQQQPTLPPNIIMPSPLPVPSPLPPIEPVTTPPPPLPTTTTTPPPPPTSRPSPPATYDSRPLHFRSHEIIDDDLLGVTVQWQTEQRGEAREGEEKEGETSMYVYCTVHFVVTYLLPSSLLFSLLFLDASLTFPLVRGSPYITALYSNLCPALYTNHAILQVNDANIPSSQSSSSLSPPPPSSRYVLLLNSGQQLLIYLNRPAHVQRDRNHVVWGEDNDGDTTSCVGEDWTVRVAILPTSSPTALYL